MICKAFFNRNSEATMIGLLTVVRRLAAGVIAKALCYNQPMAMRYCTAFRNTPRPTCCFQSGE